MPGAKNACEIDQTDQEIDEVAAALEWHNGDAEATIRTLLADCKHLREQLALAEIAMSIGYTRGWRPACIGGSEAEQP